MSSGQESTCDCGTCVAERGCTWAEYVARLNPTQSLQPEMPERYIVTNCATLSDLRALLAAQGLHIIDAKQKEVLDACEASRLCDDDPDMCESAPLEPQEHGEDCYLYTDDQYAIAKAELARRTAKDGM